MEKHEKVNEANTNGDDFSKFSLDEVMVERCYNDETSDDDERDDKKVGECPGLEPIRQKCSQDLLTCLR